MVNDNPLAHVEKSSVHRERARVENNVLRLITQCGVGTPLVLHRDIKVAKANVASWTRPLVA